MSAKFNKFYIMSLMNEDIQDEDENLEILICEDTQDEDEDLDDSLIIGNISEL